MAETIDSGGYKYWDTSLAIDSQDKVHISYYVSTSDDLKYITNATGSWVVETLDSEGTVGYFASLAVDSQDKVHISYQDRTNYDLKYITNATGSWVAETVESIGDVGWHTSLAVDSQDKVHISYHDYPNNDLKYARQCPEIDNDCDNILNYDDNCPATPNPNQLDTYPPQGNGIGDACDCEGNFDCDEDVDAEDLTEFLSNFGRNMYHPYICTNSTPCPGDFSCDTDVDGADVTMLLEDFGRGTYDRPCPICDGSVWCSYP